MNLRSVFLKNFFFLLLLFFICISLSMCQDEDEEDEDTYDEELAEIESTTTRRYRIRTSTKTSAAGRNDTVTQSAGTADATDKSVTSSPLAATGAESSASASSAVTSVPSPATPPVTEAARVTVRTTTFSDYEDEETTTEEAEEEGYAYIFRPLNSLVDNIVAGNVTGIVDNALSIRTPPEIRAFVNNVMSNVFNSGVGSALKHFMPSIFSTRAPPTSSPGRDPIPTQATKKKPAPPPLAAVVQGFEGRTNDTDEVNASPDKKPMEIAFAGHPGSPASRLKCQILP
ncbi:unnamed protein product [Orchesella dallaii]|uniref:Uncharacterized protein n=1 Tax=Orchesella dallaii TaxID=48710 RepID=A0ABP1PZD0_9HEXA